MGEFSSRLYNDDLAPTLPEQRTWNVWNIAALWVGMAVCIPTYMLASSLIADGLNWVEALMMILLGNLIVVVPMVLNGHAGARYGIPFPVFIRSSFGIWGAHIPSLLRALVACGWFGIQTWVGGQSIDAILGVLAPDIWSYGGHEFVSYFLFWLTNLYFVWNGTESIKHLETFAAPMLLLVGLVLLWWGTANGGGLANVLEKSNELHINPVAADSPRATASGSEIPIRLRALVDVNGKPKARWVKIGLPSEDGSLSAPGGGEAPWREYSAETSLELPAGAAAPGRVGAYFDHDEDHARTSSLVIATVGGEPQRSAGEKLLKYLFWLTAMVGFWATLALNIPDITRYARSQRDQLIGQILGLPATMVLYSFIGIAVTCSTLVIFPHVVIGKDAIWDPTQLLANFPNPIVLVVAAFSLAVATLSTNIAANVISPANSFSAALPRWISFRTGGVIAAVIGLLMMPWKLLGVYASWLLAYSGLLGPVVGVMLADYFFVRRCELDVDGLYLEHGPYRYWGGFNPAALLCLVAGMGTIASGLFVESLSPLYDGAWFTGCIISLVLYPLLFSAFGLRKS